MTQGKEEQRALISTKATNSESESEKHPRLLGTEIHGELLRSVKSIDKAAKIAQNLGNLMSKVAMQQNGKLESKSSGVDSPLSFIDGHGRHGPISTSTEAIDPELSQLLQQGRTRNPYNPISEEIKRRANRLSDVVEKAEMNLKLHGTLFGLNSGASPSQENRVQNQTTSTGTGTGTGTGRMDLNLSTQTQTPLAQSGRKTNNDDGNQKFEFVSDMSFTDQLMLKKLRGLKSTWGKD